MSKRPHKAAPNSPRAQPHDSLTTELSWSGPLPPPAALEHFDRTIPGGAERILAMAESEQQHRQVLEKQALSAEIADSRRGYWLGGSAVILALACAISSVYMGAHPAVSIAFVSLPVLGMVQALLKFARGKS